jgi:hypothetical protein
MGGTPETERSYNQRSFWHVQARRTTHWRKTSSAEMVNRTKRAWVSDSPFCPNLTSRLVCALPIGQRNFVGIIFNDSGFVYTSQP